MFIALDGATAPQSQQEIGLDYFDALVALCRNAEGEFLGEFCETGMEVWVGGVKLACDGAYCENKGMKASWTRGDALVVSRNGEREQTRAGV